MPWGFATSHYGRWARIDDRWAWVAGARNEHPVYAPALVAFLGTAGVGISYPDGHGPAVAWFPLAPGEIYWPSYTNDLETIRGINAGAGADLAVIAAGASGSAPAAVINGDYQNRRFASVVPRPVFTGGREVARAMIDLPERRLDNAPLLAGSPQIPPAAAPAQIASAAHTLARILEPHAAPAPARTVAVLRGGRHSGSAQIKTVAAAGHARARAQHAAKERIVTVSATHTIHSRAVHLAAAHRHLKLR
jgi:non-ribosomal peptide synthetase component F